MKNYDLKHMALTNSEIREQEHADLKACIGSLNPLDQDIILTDSWFRRDSKADSCGAGSRS